MTVYGITNCDTIKKALAWLTQNDCQFEFHGYKKKGITADKLKQWSQKVGWEKLVNKKGTTWRKLPSEQQLKVVNEKSATELMMEKPSVIKRPVIESGERLIIGFDEGEYQNTFKMKQGG